MRKGNRIMKYALTTGVSAMALAVAAPALAQNNDSEITQTNLNNQATVTQGGSENESDIVQDGAPNGLPSNPANIAEVTQAGTDGYSSIDQTGDTRATVTQTATADGMNSVIVQDSGSSNTRAIVEQSGLGLGKNTDPNSATFTGSFVRQTGSSGNARVQQREATIDAVSIIDQSGGSKRAEVIQQSGTANSVILQSGGAMQTEVYQDGSNTSQISQSGQFHTAAVRQEGGDGNFSEIVQTGVNGEAGDPINDPNGLPLGITDGELGVWQIGNLNQSEVFQYGTDQVADVIQNGNANESSITQRAPGNFVIADVYQEGDENQSTIEQSGPNTATAGFANAAYVEQVGFSNRSFVYQDDDAASLTNTANVDQLGDNGESTVTQTGNSNTANLLQADLTDGNISAITQGGSGNTANVFQYSSGNNSTVIQSSANSTINVTQGAAPPP